jgi:hypothetical protein
MSMRLTWKDGVATLLVAAVVGMYWAYLANVELPLVSEPRALGVAAIVVGLAACAVGSTTTAGTRFASALGVFAAVPGFAAIIAIVTGSGVALAVLVGGIVVMWLAATVQHASGHPAGVTDGDVHRMIDEERHTPARR